MYHVTATKARNVFSDIINKAQKEPVIIERQHKDIAVLMSFDKYEQLTATNIEQLKHFSQRISQQAQEKGLTESKLKQLLDDKE